LDEACAGMRLLSGFAALEFRQPSLDGDLFEDRYFKTPRLPATADGPPNDSTITAHEGRLSQHSLEEVLQRLQNPLLPLPGGEEIMVTSFS